MSKDIEKVYASNVKYIDPAGCGSTVGYRIYGTHDKDHTYSYAYADVEIADCGRKVSWSFDFDEFFDGLQKIETAILMLHEFKNEFMKAAKSVKQESDIVEKKKAEREAAKVSTKK